MIAEKVIRGITLTDHKIEVVVIGSREMSKATSFIASMASFLPPSCTPVEGYQAVIDYPGLDAVYIPLPSALHVEWVQKAAQKGLHIMLEKPTAASDEDHEKILEAVTAHNVFYMDGTMWSHNHRAREISEIIRSNAIGSVVNVDSSFTFMGDSSFFSSNVRTQPSADPLGALGDLAWYCVRASLFAFDFAPPTSVQAYPGTISNEEGVVLAAGATLLWPGGRKASFSCSFNQALTQKLFIGGTEGSISLNDFVIPNKEDVALFTVTSGHGLGKFNTHVITKSETRTVLMEKPQESLMWEEFARCIQSPSEGSGRKKWIEMSKITMKVVLAVRASINQGNALVEI